MRKKLSKTLAPMEIYLRDINEIPILPRNEVIGMLKEIDLYTWPYRKLSRLIKLTFRKSKPRPYTSDTEVRIVRYISQIRKNYQRAVELIPRVVECNTRFAVSEAKKYLRGGLNFSELVTVANHALLIAAYKFNYRKGCAFTTYAGRVIFDQIKKAIADESRVVRTPVHMFWRTGGVNSVSLETVFGEVCESLVDKSTGNRDPIDSDVKALLLNGVEKLLDERECFVIRKRYRLDGSHAIPTLKELGIEMGVTKQRVRQLEVRAICKLRKALMKSFGED